MIGQHKKKLERKLGATWREQVTPYVLREDATHVFLKLDNPFASTPKSRFIEHVKNKRSVYKPPEFGLGHLLERGIDIGTYGCGKKLAKALAAIFGRKTCNCW